MSDDLPQHVAALCQTTEAEPFLTAFQAATRSAASLEAVWVAACRHAGTHNLAGPKPKVLPKGYGGLLAVRETWQYLDEGERALPLAQALWALGHEPPPETPLAARPDATASWEAIAAEVTAKIDDGAGAETVPQLLGCLENEGDRAAVRGFLLARAARDQKDLGLKFITLVQALHLCDHLRWDGVAPLLAGPLHVLFAGPSELLPWTLIEAHREKITVTPTMIRRAEATPTPAQFRSVRAAVRMGAALDICLRFNRWVRDGLSAETLTWAYLYVAGEVLAYAPPATADHALTGLRFAHATRRALPWVEGPALMELLLFTGLVLREAVQKAKPIDMELPLVDPRERPPSATLAQLEAAIAAGRVEEADRAIKGLTEDNRIPEGLFRLLFNGAARIDGTRHQGQDFHAFHAAAQAVRQTTGLDRRGLMIGPVRFLAGSARPREFTDRAIPALGLKG